MANQGSTTEDTIRRSSGPGQATVETRTASASAAVAFEAEWESACESALRGMDLTTSPDLLLVFIDSRYAEHYAEIIARLRASTGARHLIGASGQSVIGSSLEAEERSAIAILGFSLPGAEFTPLAIDPESMTDDVFEPIQDGPEVWLMFSNPFTVMTDRLVGHLQQLRPEIVLLGGMASSHQQQAGCGVFIDDQALSGGAVMMGLTGGLSAADRRTGRGAAGSAVDRDRLREQHGQDPGLTASARSPARDLDGTRRRDT